MTEEKKAEIIKLVLEAHKASERLKALGMQNMAQSPEEKEKAGGGVCDGPRRNV